jgi:sugar/nucleoside kinase (ribokinase family)
VDVFMPSTGRIFLDLVFAGLDRIPVPGEEHFARQFEMMAGGMYNAARALHRLGAHVELAADLGNDLPSKIIRELWEADGLPDAFLRRHDKPTVAVTCSFSLADDRAFLSYIDEKPAPLADPAIIDENDVQCVLLSGIPENDIFIPLLERAKARNIPVYMDSQFDHPPMTQSWMPRLISLVDTLFCNEGESKALSGKERPEDAGRVLCEMGPTVVIKLGAKGALLTNNDSSFRLPAPPLEVVDTTGAGDCFVAGYCYAKLHGHDDRGALAHAITCGSLSCGGAGGAAAPSADELLASIKKHFG